VTERVPTDYDTRAGAYSTARIPDRRLERRIHAALGDARSVINVGAGTGAYEPTDREVLAIEPSAAMIAARPSQAAPAVQATAESLPVADRSYEAAMAILTMHHWTDVRAGLAELRRVARHRIVLFTWDPDFDDALWLTQRYFPRIREQDRVCFPRLSLIESVLGALDVEPVPIPYECTDGFLGSRWRRPSAYLDPQVRDGMSGFSRLTEAETATGIKRLRDDLDSGAWRERFDHLLDLDEMDLGYRLIVAESA
jgi:SAM-dependent methyltransferase